MRYVPAQATQASAKTALGWVLTGGKNFGILGEGGRMHEQDL